MAPSGDSVHSRRICSPRSQGEPRPTSAGRARPKRARRTLAMVNLVIQSQGSRALTYQGDAGSQSS
jgi:hypothetical protein